MPRLRGVIAGVAVIAVIATMTASEVLASGAISAFTVNGTPGSYLLPGGSVDLDSSNAYFTMQPYGNGFNLIAQGVGNGHFWDATIVAPQGSTLSVGTYPTQPSPIDPDEIWFDLGGDGRGCSSDGSITISELERDPDTHLVSALAVTYQVACEPNEPAISGELRYQSSVDYVAASTTPGGLDFGTRDTGATTQPLTLTVRADGTQPVNLGVLALGGTTPKVFSISSDGCSGQVLAPGQTCAIGVTAHPSVVDVQSAVLTLPTSTVAGRLIVPLTVTGAYPSASVVTSPASVAFGAALVGTATSTVPVTLTSTGFTAVRLGTAAISGATPAAFSLGTDTCSNEILFPGQQCTVNVTARPTALGVQHATLDLPHTVPGGSSSVPLSVAGVTGATGTYYPLPPTRILDTRSGNGAAKAPLGAGGVLHLQVGGRGGVPASGVSAVVLNVTVTGPTSTSFLSVYPSGAARPVVSSLNFGAGWTGANNVTVPLGAGGKVDLYNLAGKTQVVADVLGFYAADNSLIGRYGVGGRYQPVSPQRLVDTRDPSYPGPLPGGYYLNVAVDYGRITNAHVRALAVNVTAVNPTANGFLTTWDGQPYGLPEASTVNFSPHATVPNLAVVPVSTCPSDQACAGLPSIGVYNGSKGSVHIIVDIVGFFDDGAEGSGLTFHPLGPTRIADTRIGLGAQRFGPKTTAAITAPATVADSNTAAVVANVTAVAPTASTYLSVWAAGAALPPPLVSTLNAAAGRTVPNAALITIGPTAGFNVFNNAGSVDVLVDVAGIFEADSGGVAGVLSLGGTSPISHLLFNRPEPIRR